MRAGKEKAEELHTLTAAAEATAQVKVEDAAQDETAAPKDDKPEDDQQEASSSTPASPEVQHAAAAAASSQPQEPAFERESAMTGTDPATRGWQAIWDDTRGQYYFWNEDTQTSTWENPFEKASTSAAAAAAREQPPTAQRQPGEIDPELAFLDPSLALATATRTNAPGPSSTGALYSSAAHFDPKTGRFLGSSTASSSSALTDKHAAYGDPSRYFSSSQRAKRQMDVFFDSEAWEEDKAAKAAELDRKRRRIEEGGGGGEEEGEHAREGAVVSQDALYESGSTSKLRPTKKELQAFQAKKQQRKKAKLDWLRT